MSNPSKHETLPMWLSGLCHCVRCGSVPCSAHLTLRKEKRLLQQHRSWSLVGTGRVVKRDGGSSMATHMHGAPLLADHAPMPVQRHAQCAAHTAWLHGRSPACTHRRCARVDQLADPLCKGGFLCWDGCLWSAMLRPLTLGSLQLQDTTQQHAAVSLLMRGHTPVGPAWSRVSSTQQ